MNAPCSCLGAVLLSFVVLLAAPAPALAESGGEESEGVVGDGYVLFPGDEFFDPLIADLRWPRFSAAHQWRLGTDEFNRVANVSFGETFAFVQSPEYDWGRWEFGLHAMVDAIFDMTSQSFDLANEDYFVALAFTYHGEHVTALARLSHTSSHLGDEYLLANALDRESVSYEVIDVTASKDVYEWLRLYGGIGFYLNATPDFDPFLSQWGFELTSPVSFGEDGLLTPIFATDLQIRQENDWTPEVAVLAGVRIAETPKAVRNLEFFARFYHGQSPDGQFFENTIDLVGVGFRMGF